MSQLQHVEEDSLISGGPLHSCPNYMLRKTHWSVEAPCRHVPTTTCWGRLTGQWRPPADMSPLQHVEEDSLVSGGPLQTCPHYNMLRKTHWSVEAPCRHVPTTTCWGRLTGQWRSPADMSPLQHVEEDSLVSGGPLQTCPHYNMLRKTHWSVEVPCRHVPTTTCWGRLTGQWRPPEDMSPLQHVEEDSLVSGGPLQTCPHYNMLRKTHWSVEAPCRHVPTTTCWGRLTGQWRPPADMSPLQHVEEDSLVSGGPLKTCPHYNMLKKTHWPVEAPCRHVPTTTCWGRPTGQWKPPWRPGSLALSSNWKGQINSPGRPYCPCDDQWITRRKT